MIKAKRFNENIVKPEYTASSFKTPTDTQAVLKTRPQSAQYS
jgi:hypothetical protein